MKYPMLSLWCKRFGWLLTIWLLSILALGIFAYCLRFIMASIGMTIPG